MATFTAKATADDLLAAVRDVSSAVNPDDPRAVSQREFDAARADAGWADAPLARTICRRLDVGWEYLLRAVHHPTGDVGQLVAVGAANHGRVGLSLDDVLAAMRQAAIRLGQRTLSTLDYDRAHREMSAARNRRRNHRNLASDGLPERYQIVAVLSKHEMTWTDGLTAAGLEPLEAPDPRRAPPVIEVLKVFAEAQRAIPVSMTQLERWARREGIAVPRRVTRARLDEAIGALKDERRAAGEPELPVSRSGLDHLASIKREGPPLLHKKWTEEEIVEGLVVALSLLGPRERLTQSKLRELADEHAEIPGYSVIFRLSRRLKDKGLANKDFPSWRSEAARRLRARRTTSA